MATLKHKINPFIPKAPHKEIPVREELVHEHSSLEQVHTMKPDFPVLVPNYNILYDSLRTKQAWRYLSDGYATGTVTTVAGSAVTSSVALTLPSNTQSPNWRLEQWPGGTMLYLSIRMFSFGPQTATFTTQGEINVLFVDQFGNVTPLGIVPNNAFTTNSFNTILPGAITDSGQQANLGNLSFTLNTGATVGTYAWQLGLSAVYMLPALKGYNVERMSDHVKQLELHHKRTD